MDGKLSGRPSDLDFILMKRPRAKGTGSSRKELVTTPERSKLMSGVRQRGTAPELAVRAALRRLGVAYRLNVRSLPGRPDVANVSRGFAIYVHGCFWHRHVGCKRTTTPTRNHEFWVTKFNENIERDRRTQDAVRARGVSVCVIWECETEDQSRLEEIVRRRLPSKAWKASLNK